MQPGLFAQPHYTDAPLGLTGWTPGELGNEPNGTDTQSRELEPSWYVRADGALVMVFRDQAGESMVKLAAVSTDDGQTWTAPAPAPAPAPTNVPDARTKQSAGNLPDGTAYLVGYPTGGGLGTC